MTATKRQRIRDIMKHPEQEVLLEETYDEMEAKLQKKNEGIRESLSSHFCSFFRYIVVMESQGSWQITRLSRIKPLFSSRSRLREWPE